MALLDLAGNEVKQGDLIAVAVARKSTLMVGEVVEIVWRTEPFQCWGTAMQASPEKPFAQMRVQYPHNKRTVFVNGVQDNFIKIIKE